MFENTQEHKLTKEIIKHKAEWGAKEQSKVYTDVIDNIIKIQIDIDIAYLPKLAQANPQQGYGDFVRQEAERIKPELAAILNQIGIQYTDIESAFSLDATKRVITITVK